MYHRGNQYDHYTVGQLIKALKQYPADMPVECDGWYDGGYAVDGGTLINIRISTAGEKSRFAGQRVDTLRLVGIDEIDI